MDNPPSIRFRLWELLTLPAIVGALVIVGGAASLRESIPLVFALWIAIHQRHIPGLPVINPFTVGAVAGMICFVVYDLATLTAGQQVSVAVVSRTAFTGAVAGLGFGLAACLYTTLGQLVLEPFHRRLWPDAGKSLRTDIGRQGNSEENENRPTD